MSEQPFLDVTALRKLDAKPGDVFVLELPEDWAMPTDEEMARMDVKFRAAVGFDDVRLLVTPPGTSLVKQPASRHLGILRVSKELLADMIGLPAGARIDAISESLYFDSDEFALRIEHPALPAIQPGNAAVPVVAEVTGGEFAVKMDWSKEMPGTKPTIRPDAAKLAALLREASNFLTWRTADGLDLALRLRDAAVQLEGGEPDSALSSVLDSMGRAIGEATDRMMMAGGHPCPPDATASPPVVVPPGATYTPLNGPPVDMPFVSLKEANEQHAREGDSDVAALAEAAGEEETPKVNFREWL